MKNLLLVIFLCVGPCTSMAQDKDLEGRFFSERKKIKKAKIREITEFVSQYWKNQCVRDSAYLRFRYTFDFNGHLVRVDQYSGGQKWKTIRYLRAKTGQFLQKSYTFYDSSGNEQSVDDWILKFNKKRQLVSEIWIKGRDTVRINKLTYNQNGYLIEQVANNVWFWRLYYDKKGHIITSKDCTRWGDSIKCQPQTYFSYRYDGDLLKRKVSNHYLLGMPSKEFEYIYDADNKLIEMRDYSRWLTQQGMGPTKVTTSVSLTKYEYDDLGNCTVESEYSESEVKPFRCKYYKYSYFPGRN